MEYKVNGDITGFTFKLTNLLNSNLLSEKELDIVIQLAKRDLSISWFTKPFVDEFCKDIKVSYPEVMKIKKSLLEKGVLTQSESKNKKLATFNDKLKVQIASILEKKELILTLKYES